MKKTIVIVGVLAVAATVGMYFFTMRGHEGSKQTGSEAGTNDPTKLIENQITSEPVSQDTIDGNDETEIVALSVEEISALRARSQQVGSELDSLTKELDSQLENPERRKSIQAQYQQLANEQNMLAIQLVKANQLQMSKEE